MIGEKVWIRIAYCNDIPVREGRAVRAGRREIAIFNLGSRFLAVENRCPHRGGPLADGIVSGTTIVCPLHAWKFSLESGAGVSATSQGSCVGTFPSRVEDGIVSLELPLDSDEEEIPPLCLEGDKRQAWTWSQPVRVIDEL